MTSNIIEFTLSQQEVLDITDQWITNGGSFMYIEQCILDYCKKEYGLVCKGVIHLVPLGEITSWYDKELHATHFKQVICDK